MSTLQKHLGTAALEVALPWPSTQPPTFNRKPPRPPSCGERSISSTMSPDPSRASFESCACHRMSTDSTGASLSSLAGILLEMIGCCCCSCCCCCCLLLLLPLAMTIKGLRLKIRILIFIYPHHDEVWAPSGTFLWLGWKLSQQSLCLRRAWHTSLRYFAIPEHSGPRTSRAPDQGKQTKISKSTLGLSHTTRGSGDRKARDV